MQNGLKEQPTHARKAESNTRRRIKNLKEIRSEKLNYIRNILREALRSTLNGSYTVPVDDESKKFC